MSNRLAIHAWHLIPEPWQEAGADGNPERALWLAVLVRQIDDAEGPDSLERDQARRWFGSRDFYLVCDYASVHPQRVLERLTSYQPYRAPSHPGRPIRHQPQWRQGHAPGLAA